MADDEANGRKAFIREDPRSFSEQILDFAERGTIAPESLSLREIKMLCVHIVRQPNFSSSLPIDADPMPPPFEGESPD